MKALILALATAVPQFCTNQQTIAQRIIDMCQLRAKTAESITNLYSKTKIDMRYSVLKDFQSTPEESTLFNNEFLEKIPGTKIRNNIYCQQAPKLALESAKKAIANWGGLPSEITHIISVSCTGVMAPGIEFILQKELNLNNNVQRLGINLMGCFGAFKGLAIANALAKENPKNRILVVCTELCSLHFQVSIKPEVLIGNALFSDGSAAVIVGCNKKESETALWSIEQSESHAFDNSQEKMTWLVSDNGFVMTLEKDVPSLIEKEVPEILKNILKNKNYNDLVWAIHPGGKAIIEGIQRGCNLTTEQTQSSWNVLSQYGNMSSATFLFVLNDLIKNKKNNKETIGIGFGPGLSLETILLGQS